MYKLKLHKNLSEDKWRSFGKAKQLLMIANELNRAKNWLSSEDFEAVKHCYERAFELLDLTISVTVSRNLRRELLRFREMLALQYINEAPCSKPQGIKVDSSEAIAIPPCGKSRGFLTEEGKKISVEFNNSLLNVLLSLDSKTYEIISNHIKNPSSSPLKKGDL